MSNLEFKHLLKKKGVQICFLTVCSLLISEKVLAVYDKGCCRVQGNSSFIKPQSDYITIFFKFFEYEPKLGEHNSFLRAFDVKYSTGKRFSFKHLASAWTLNQTFKTCAWVDFKHKQPIDKIELYSCSRYQPDSQATIDWKDDTNPRLEVATETNEAWCGIRWYPGSRLLSNVTFILIRAIWYDHKSKKTEKVLLVYNINPLKAKLTAKSLNFSNSSPNQEITTEEKSNMVKAYKNANLIVVKGAHHKTIRVYTTTGALVKSVLAESDLFQITVPANQLYVVNVGQARYKVAL